MTSSPVSKLVSTALGAALVAAALTAHAALTWKEDQPALPVAGRAYHFEARERRLAECAFGYLVKNRLETGLVSSAASFEATTMWDVASQLAGLTAARELGLLAPAEFDAWVGSALGTLGRLPLYRGELPNKSYNARTLMPVDYGKLHTRKEIGFSALDVARLVLWLDLVAARYPQHAAACRAVTARWKLERLAQGGQLKGTDAHRAEETWDQEGRLGYEQYAAYALARLGLDVARARSPYALATRVEVLGVDVPVDVRDVYDSEAHNYVTSEPFILDGLETGFRALTREYAASVLEAQRQRWKATGTLTAWSEDNLDKAPWFVYNSVFVDGRPWSTLDTQGRDAGAFRGSSVKAAVGWHVLFRTPYTERVYVALADLVDPELGVFAGFYEEGGKVNEALTLNTNGIVLEALLYAKVGQPLEDWAHGRPRR